MQEFFATYIDELHAAYRGGGTEHSGRTPLENLLKAIKPELIAIQHEPQRAGSMGSPDFKMMRGARILGYLENKAPGENLDKVLKSAQIKKYGELSDNLIITDYLQWIWLREGKIIARETLGYENELQDPRFMPPAEKSTAVCTLLEGFFSVDPEPVADPEELAERLAARARHLRDALTAELTRQRKEETGGRLIGLYGVFRDQVFHQLKMIEFADAFAQMLAYSLFLARLNAGANQQIDLHNV